MSSPPAAGQLSRLRASPAASDSGGRRPLVLAGVMVGAAVALAITLAYAPFLSLGVALGTLLLALILLRPLLVVGIMLALGPIDLSFVTGGFKSLFPELGGLDMNGIRLIGMVGGLSVLALLERNGLRTVFSFAGRWYLLFLLFAAFTLLQSLSLIDGLRLLLKLSYPFLIFVTVVGMARTRQELDRLADAALVGAAIIAIVLNPLFFLAGGYHTDLMGNVRAMGVGTHENPFSFYLLVMLLVAFVRFSVRRQLRYLLLGLVFCAWIALSLTRITLLASMAALFAVALYAAIVQRDRRALIGALIVGAVIAIPLTPVALERTFYGRIPSLEELLGLFRDPVALYETINWQGRELFWAVLIASFLASPWVGLGLGSSTAILRANFPPEAGLAPHNEYIRLLTEAGLIGVGLFFIAIMHWLIAAIRAGRTQAPLVREWALPAVASIIAWAIISGTDNPFDYYAPFTQYVGFLCAGAVVAARLVEAGEGETPDGGERGHGPA